MSHALLRFCAATMMEPLHFALWTGALARGLRLATQEPDARMLLRRFVHGFNFTPSKLKVQNALSFSKKQTNTHLSLSLLFLTFFTSRCFSLVILFCPALRRLYPGSVYSLCRTRLKRKPTRGGKACASLIRVDGLAAHGRRVSSPPPRTTAYSSRGVRTRARAGVSGCLGRPRKQQGAPGQEAPHGPRRF